MYVPMINSIQELKAFMNAPDHKPLCIVEKKIFEKIKDYVLDDSLNTLSVCTTKRQVTLIFKRNNHTDSMRPVYFEIPDIKKLKRYVRILLKYRIIILTCVIIITTFFWLLRHENEYR